MSKIAITQPNYLPWLGYFDLIDEVDTWVSLDNVLLSKRSFIVRNKVFLKKERWLSLNIEKKSNNILINNSVLFLQSRFWEKHISIIKNYYFKTPYFDQYIKYIEKIITPHEKNLSKYNERIIKEISKLLGISFHFKRASEITSKKFENPEDRIIYICKKLDATKYYNFKNGIEVGLYHSNNFLENGITLYKQDYKHPIYNQYQNRNGFVPYMSILDLLFNEGESSLEIIRKGRNWIKQM